jgi:putative transposase
VTRSRELVAAGYRPAVVARIAQISRQAIYRVPKKGRRGRRDRGRRLASTARSSRSRRRTRATATGWSRRSSAPSSAGREPQASAAADARAQADPAPPVARPSSAARVLPRRAARQALAPRADLGLGRRARPVPPDGRDRLLHPRARRLAPRAALPGRRGDRARRTHRAAASRPARSPSAPTTGRPSVRERSTSVLSVLGIVSRRGGYRDPESQAFIESWFSKLKELCVWLHEFETLDQAGEVIAAHIDRYHHRPHSDPDYRTPGRARPDLARRHRRPTNRSRPNRQPGPGAGQGGSSALVSRRALRPRVRRDDGAVRRSRGLPRQAPGTDS